MDNTDENKLSEEKTADGIVPEKFNEVELDELVYGERKKNPMDGVTLKIMLINLEEYYGWEGLGERIEIRCFNHDPSMKSSLKFLRKNEWARKKVEKLYEITFL
ncbi:hypothetical protein LNTAR_12751 [Lentisphaera araneosa HTCC2155]|uniref:Transporter n=1 Tax=Lentisphaera araneosa HTCC2155 TaxID=313628 RepID=A6DK01_9BACT|nr:VF530 family protein [Lentisphaera araneosa]EDM28225.1 hypothetical protein LNTAR_12751 [Lentisphaera araneosa HTCC2155]